MKPDRPLLDEAIRHLSAIDRPSASEGEHRAAEWIAERLRDEGCDARVEEERAHGGYWWPLGILSGVGAVAGLAALRAGRTRRGAGIVAGAAAAAAAAIWDDVSGGRLWFRRRALPHRSTWNVVAEAGDRGADRTLVLVAHHDAANSGLVFHPGIPRLVGERFPGLIERHDTSPPLLMPVFAGPVLVALGALTRRRGLVRAGTFLAAGSAVAFADIGARGVVPGANDNATGVAALLGVARALREEPVAGLRVLLVSTGSEESFMEGMQAFARRHFPALPRDRTVIVALDTVGSPELVVPEGEGMLRMRDYPAETKDLLSAAARDAGVHLRRGLRLSFATDGLIALRAGYPSAIVGSVDRYKAPSNYHWPTDVPENVDLDRVADAVRLSVAAVRRLAVSATAAP